MGLVLLLSFPDLEDLATAGLKTEVGGTWFAGRSEADLIAAWFQFVDAERDLFLGGGGVHLFWIFRCVKRERPRPSGGVLASPGKRKVLPLTTIVVCLTLSSGKAFLSSIVETSFQVPCISSRSFMVARNSGLLCDRTQGGKAELQALLPFPIFGVCIAICVYCVLE